MQTPTQPAPQRREDAAHTKCSAGPALQAANWLTILFLCNQPQRRRA